MGYIFGSKIEKKIYHVKYRYKFIRAIENPDEFTNIKWLRLVILLHISTFDLT